VNGNDANDGATPVTAFKTFAVAQASMSSSDVLYLLPAPGQIITKLQERMVITKDFIHVRGPGTIFHIHPTAVQSGSIIEVLGQGVSISGVTIETDAASGGGIHMMGDANLFEDIHINGVPGIGFFSEDCSHTVLRRCKFESMASHGINIQHCNNLVIDSCYIDGAGGDGIRIEGNASGSSTETDIINSILDNLDVAINIASGSTYVKIRETNRFIGTIGTPILDNGTYTHIEENLKIDAVWAEPLSDITATGSVGEHIKKKVLTTNRFVALK